MVLVSLKHFVSVLQAFHRSLRIYRVAVGIRCAEVVEILFKIGCLHYQVNEYMAALLAFEEALEVEEILANEEPIRKAELLCHIGFAKIKLQQYGDSIICLEEALSVSYCRCQHICIFLSWCTNLLINEINVTSLYQYKIRFRKQNLANIT